LQPPGRATHLVKGDSQHHAQARVTEARAGVFGQMPGDVEMTTIVEHLDAEWTWRLVQIDVLAVALFAVDIQLCGLVHAGSVTQGDVHDFACNRAGQRTAAAMPIGAHLIRISRDSSGAR
jgi:hypothetical protein